MRQIPVRTSRRLQLPRSFGKAYPFTISGRLDQTQQYGQVQLAMPPDGRTWVNSVLASYTNTNVSDTRIYSARVGVQRTRSLQNIDTHVFAAALCRPTDTESRPADYQPCARAVVAMGAP